MGSIVYLFDYIIYNISLFNYVYNNSIIIYNNIVLFFIW